jgi:PIN domain nuclease of toxin-antitoxin system
LVRSPENEKTVSAASLWEMAIKHRLGKLALRVPIEALADVFLSLKFSLLSVDHHHAVAALHETPATRDPFDRLLLAQCQVEGMRLVTLDRALAAHPLAWHDG